MADQEQCPLHVAACLLKITSASREPIDVLTALDDYFHVPRHTPYIEQAKQRVQQAHDEFEASGTLPSWVHHAICYLSGDPHKTIHHHSIE